MLHEALLSLILKKRYETITVDEICETANVSRSTFYDHYMSKGDLEQSHFKQFRAQILKQHSDLTDGKRTAAAQFEFSLPMLQHAREHLHHYKALVANRGAVATGTIRGILYDLVRRELPIEESKKAVDREFAVEFVVGAYMSVLTWWLDRGAKLPPEHVDALFQRFTVGGVLNAWIDGSAGHSRDNNGNKQQP